MEADGKISTAAESELWRCDRCVAGTWIRMQNMTGLSKIISQIQTLHGLEDISHCCL